MSNLLLIVNPSILSTLHLSQLWMLLLLWQYDETKIEILGCIWPKYTCTHCGNELKPHIHMALFLMTVTSTQSSKISAWWAFSDDNHKIEVVKLELLLENPKKNKCLCKFEKMNKPDDFFKLVLHHSDYFFFFLKPVINFFKPPIFSWTYVYVCLHRYDVFLTMINQINK